jgi:nitrogen regulatory protein PII
MGEIVMNELERLAVAIREEHQECLQKMRQGVEHALKVGELLVKAKELVKHGEWEQWVEVNCSFTSRMARNYIIVFENVEDGLLKTETISEMTIREVLGGGERTRRDKRAEGKAERKRLKELGWKLENENHSVKTYLDTVKVFRKDVRDAVDVAEFGKFSPEGMRFTVRKNDEIRQELDRLEDTFREHGTKAFTWAKEPKVGSMLDGWKAVKTGVKVLLHSEVDRKVSEYYLGIMVQEMDEMVKEIHRRLEGGEPGSV